MHISEMKKNARTHDILGIHDKPTKCEPWCFTCGCKNSIGVPEVRRGTRIDPQGEVIIYCQRTGVRDIEDRMIYITPDGMTFVCDYSATHPDLVSPKMTQ